MDEFTEHRLSLQPSCSATVVMSWRGMVTRVCSVMLNGCDYTRVEDGTRMEHYIGDIDILEALKRFHKVGSGVVFRD